MSHVGNVVFNYAPVVAAESKVKEECPVVTVTKKVEEQKECVVTNKEGGEEVSLCRLL